MRKLARLINLLCALAIIGLSFWLWSATGRAGYTKYFDADRAQRDQQAASEDSIADLFEEAGADVEPPAPLENRFQFGLAPIGIDRHLVSVTTIAGPAAVVALISVAGLLVPGKKRRK
ncbi:MAG: hypothetical protein VYC34_10200 [Planctomycetota bacterium]|nr:hypothetical protein [Planctomycetota bacterium]